MGCFLLLSSSQSEMELLCTTKRMHTVMPLASSRIRETIFCFWSVLRQGKIPMV